MIAAGEGGIAGLARLAKVTGDPALRAEIRLGSDPRVLLINTEAATGLALYKRLVGVQ